MSKKSVVKGLTIILGMIMTLSLVACGSSSSTSSTGTSGVTSSSTEATSLASDGGYKVGWSLITTSDPVVAQAVKNAQEEAKTKGIDLLVSDAGRDASKQLDAVENFIESGCKAIIIQAIDASSMSEEAAKAMEKGIKVVAYGIGLENCDVWYKNDNTVTGTAIGEMASDWINQQLDGKANVYIIGYSMMDVLVERADAIEAAIKKGSPDASIIGRFDAIDSEAGMKNTESMLSAHPEVNCIVSISDGPAVGAYEAVKSAGKDGDDFGIFGSDLSLQALQYIKDGTCYRGTTDVDNLTSGQMAIDICADLVQGKDVEKTITMGCKKVTADNVGDYAALLK